MEPSITDTQEAPSTLLLWRDSCHQPRFVGEVLLTVTMLALSVYICREVMLYAHTRPGVVLDDPIQRMVGPVNLRWPVFLILWSSLVMGVCSLAKTPDRLLMWLQAAALLTLFRALALYLLPLAAPPTIIPLADPIATLRTGAGDLITNDLFFSGHTAVLFLLFLAVGNTRLRWFCFVGFVFVGIAVVIQHVHYSGDVFAAPFFAYGSYQMVMLAHNQMKEIFSY